MKYIKQILPAVIAMLFILPVYGQVEDAGGVRRRNANDRKQEKNVGITDRMQSFYENKPVHDADLEYMREIYREIDLEKEANAPLYFPEDIVDGQKNLFRIIMEQVVDGKLPAYEYLDGREVFTDEYKVKVGDMLDRFGIYYTEGKGSTEKNPKYEIEEADMPTGQVLTYYILEKWEFDRRSNRMRTRVEAICPVLTRAGDFGGEARYPMFWVKFDALRPWLAQQYIFLSDDNNMPQYSLDDYFNLGMYQGDIYKTKNLRNLSMNQMYPDEDMLKQAQDSIDRRLREYGNNLYVPTREEYLAKKEAEAEAERLAAENAAATEAGDNIPVREDVSVSELQPTKKTSTRKKTSTTKKRSNKKPKQIKSSGGSSNSNANKSVRRRRKGG
ncbi:MAG: gliding motility protein GldN [Prevotella sp.]|nr:gliding motility protein GldN [Bacteroides sp.]MCM1366445.1 gliding motility protein GldN [Prevotella sp.]MCM1437075.1 gliding motility protein GldN [Prevotella sp.]